MTSKTQGISVGAGDSDDEFGKIPVPVTQSTNTVEIMPN